jgi:HEAT repeat protein
MFGKPRVDDVRARLRAAKDRRAAAEAIAPLARLRGAEAVEAIVGLMIECEAWPELLEEALEAALVEMPSLATRQRLLNGWNPPAQDLLERRGHRWAVAAALTFHTNGFVREKALRRLAETGDPRGWPFLLNRTTDWVPQVARTARTLYDRVTHSKSNAELAHLLAVERAVSRRERGGRAFRRPPWDRLLRDETALRMAFRDSETDALWLLSSLSELDPGSPIYQAARGSVYGPVRLRAVKLLKPGPETSSLAEALARDPYPPVRLAALDIAARAGDAGRPLLERALFDSNMRVRTHARLALGPADYATRYRAALPDPTAVEGLGETGTKADADLIVPLLEHPTPLVRRAAIRALVRLDARQATDAVLRRIGDPSVRVVREAFRALEPLNTGVGWDAIDAALADLRRPAAARRATLRWMHPTARWETGARLMRYGDDPDLRPVVGLQLERWRKRMATRRAPPRDAFQDEYELRVRQAE